MQRLKGRILRAYKSHKSPEGALYGSYCRAKASRYEKLPQDARIALREAGRCVVEIDWLARELDSAVRARRLTAARRLRRELRNARFILEKLEARFERLATPPTELKPGEPIAQFFSDEEGEDVIQ